MLLLYEHMQFIDIPQILLSHRVHDLASKMMFVLVSEFPHRKCIRFIRCMRTTTAQ